MPCPGTHTLCQFANRWLAEQLISYYFNGFALSLSLSLPPVAAAARAQGPSGVQPAHDASATSKRKGSPSPPASASHGNASSKDRSLPPEPTMTNDAKDGGPAQPPGGMSE